MSAGLAAGPWGSPDRFNGGDAEAAVPGRGLHSVHRSAQPKPVSLNLPVSPRLIDWGKIMHPTYPTNCAYVEPKSG
jgi:hypothetical protein